MLRKSSRPLTSTQSKVSDHTNNNNNHHHQCIPHEKQTNKQSSFFFNSPTFLKGFFNSKNPNQIMINPISLLDKTPFSNVLDFSIFDHKKHQKQQKNRWEQFNNHKQGIGLALIDENSTIKQQKRKLVVFGSQLRRNKLQNSSVFPCVSMSDIDEESEDYTCVISHGPNPKMTRIFGNCIVESCCGKTKIVGVESRNVSVLGGTLSSQGSLSFLCFCYHCHKKLGDGKDIFMYRGEKGFCSDECRNKEMLFDQVEN